MKIRRAIRHPSSIPSTARSLALPGIVARGLFLGALAPLWTWAAPHEDTHTHASLTAGALQLVDPGFFTAARRALIVQASVDEDQCPNYLSHFYNPKTGEDGGIYTSPCDLFPTVTTAFARARDFYDDAIDLYRQGDRDAAFRKLGAVLHLMQDMTSPAHVHGDPHPQFIGGQCANDGDDFEKWGWCEAKTMAHIRDYVSSSGVITPRLQNSLDLLYDGQARFPTNGLHATHFVDHVANLVYDFTSFQVRLEDPTFFDDPQPNSELKRMFPTLREGSPGFYIDGDEAMTVGYTNSTCGGCTQDEWWLMETSCSDNGSCAPFDTPTFATGLAYIENTGGEDGGSGGTFLEDKLVPRRFEKSQFVDLFGTTLNAGIDPGFDDPKASKTLLRIYGDVLYATAVAYGAGLLQAFHDEVAPAPVAVAGGPYQGQGCTPTAFDASASSDANGTLVRYDWDFDDDGNVDTSTDVPSVEHTYLAAYTGRVVLTVIDDEGRTDQDSGDVAVTDCLVLPGSSSGGGCIGSVSARPGSGDPSLVLCLALVLVVLVLRRRAVSGEPSECAPRQLP